MILMECSPEEHVASVSVAAGLDAGNVVEEDVDLPSIKL